MYPPGEKWIEVRLRYFTPRSHVSEVSPMYSLAGSLLRLQKIAAVLFTALMAIFRFSARVGGMAGLDSR